MKGSDNSIESFSTNASKQIMGFEYQKLIAIDCCLTSKSGDIIYIECKGDVSNNDTIYEAKHHCEVSYLTDSASDFWKTLMNFVQEREKTTQFSRLILYTTSLIRNESVFSDWNKKNPDEKLICIKKIRDKSLKSIQIYTDIIFSFDASYSETDLIDILKKLEILSSQPNIYQKYEELKQKLYYVPEIHRDDLLSRLYGYVDVRLIKDSNCWRINFDDFEHDLQAWVRRYSNEKIPFPEEPTDVQYDEFCSYLFIDKLKEIDLAKEVPQAVIDFLKGDIVSIKLIEIGGSAANNAINNFEVELCDKMKSSKEIHALDLLQHQMSLDKHTNQSKRLFYSCKNFDKLSIDGVQDIRNYYQYGKMHKIVDEGLFDWKFVGDSHEQQ